MTVKKIDRRQLAREQYLEGKSLRKIGASLGVAEGTIRYWAKKENWPKPANDQAKIAQLIDAVHRQGPRKGSNAITLSDSERIELKKIAGKRPRIQRKGENIQPGNVENIETIKKERNDYAPIPPGVSFVDPWHVLGDAILRYCAELLMKTAHMSPQSLSLLTDIGLKMTMKNPPEEKKDTSVIDSIREKLAELSVTMRPPEMSDFENGEIPAPVAVDDAE